MPVLAAMPQEAHNLENHLRQLAHQLGSLAVVLRTLVLPAMPWLSVEARDRLQVEVAETSQSTASAANSLSHVTSLLPGGPAVLDASTIRKELATRSNQVSAGRDSWLYGEIDATPPAVEQPPEHVDLDVVVGAVQRLQQDGRAGPAALRRTLDMLLATPLRMTAAKLALLEAELHFCCRSVALQAQHVMHMMRSLQREPPTMKQATAGSSPAGLSHAGAGALDRVVAALEQLDRQPSEASLALLVTELQAGRPALLAAASMLASGSTGPGAAHSASGQDAQPAFQSAMHALAQERQISRSRLVDSETLDSTRMPWDYTDGHVC